MTGFQERLAERIRQGDHEAWEPLWEQLRPQIYATLGRLLRSVPGMDPEDVLGWTMAETWRLVQSHEPHRAKVGTYVVASLRGRIQNLRRDAMAKGRATLLESVRPSEDHDPLEVADEGSLFEQHRAETWADIEAALKHVELEESHAALLKTVRQFPDSSLVEVARLSNVREPETQRFFRGIGAATKTARRKHNVSRHRA